MRIMLVCLFAMACIMFPDPSHAAPFCAKKQGIAPECYYVDANECRKRAGEMGGECVANPSELTLKPGYGTFCLIGSSQSASCIYPDRDSCDKHAINNNGVCIEATKTTLQNQPKTNTVKQN